MAQNLLYMFEFAVEDLLITHPNECAPEEYPTCCELTFRSSVFVSICDREFGGCLDTNNLSKSGKCCLFGLESPITAKDKLHIHIYKKKIEKCKFLLGTTDVDMKAVFDRVTSTFIETNPLVLPNVKSTEDKFYSAQSQPQASKESLKNVIDKSGNNDAKQPRQEEYCPSSEIEKKMLSLFDLNRKQTGNIVIVIRLSCLGPNIVSPFPFSKLSSYKGCQKSELPKFSTKKNCNYGPTDKECECVDTCNEETDDCEASNENDTCSKSADSNIYPCTICPTKEPSPDAYDEFEADLNGSGMIIRVLRDAFQVSNVQDSDYESSEDNCSYAKDKHPPKTNQCMSKEFQKSSYLQNAIKSQVGGNFVNQKGLPKIRGNIKYAGNELCPTTANFELPMPVIRPCDKNEHLQNKIDKYRKRCPGNRCCCIQVQPDEIDASLNKINQQTKRNGIEICRKKCVNEDSDVFILKLGKKKRCANKQHLIEVEMRTPKVPTVLDVPKVTRETQIDEFELDAELKDICAKKKKKGKKAKK